MKHCVIKVALLMAMVVLAGCKLVELREDAEYIEQAGVIQGTVKVDGEPSGLVVAVQFREEQGKLIQERNMVVSETGSYRFQVVAGNYAIAAFVDSNGDGIFQPEEPGVFDPVMSRVRVGIDDVITMPALLIKGTLTSWPSEADMKKKLKRSMQNIGAVRKLDDPIFSAENCSLGMWHAPDFLEQVGGGVFLLQPYDAGKMPVLFIHGMGGGPDDWETAIESLDTERYQAWVVFYPSGVRLDMISDYLVSAMATLTARYQLEEIFIAAHSMGGLVNRSFIKKYCKEFPEAAAKIRGVVTVNSPMGGMPSAASGVEHSPIVLPAWRDVAVGSDFLKDLHQWDWPEEIPYHLVFSFIPGSGDDTVVPLQCQIPFKLQGEAVRSYGFENSHVGTLSDPDFLALFSKLLLQASASVE
ncbi:hypothetical protein PDESU_01003 [Pontiella desulfatans]|uniref:DUF676 domain-containing protein n=1 Tax=Pontiella desulfatans TaxID=2750659 RepID=A0A6C2TXR7_PONDE|nr:alpha/beta hydrolase [Pontiella desulfatans]VGO12450.1 hypothetical protein PDESU_01003 [Pontiella desulfatans]